MRNVNLYIDLSSTDTGVTIQDIESNEILAYSIKINDFRNEHDRNQRALLKINDLDTKLDKLLCDYVVCSIFIESSFLQKKFLNSSEMILKFHGFILHKFKDLHFFFLTPAEIKKIVAGRGNASKEDVISSIKNLGFDLSVDGKENDNIYDSFAIFIAFYLQNNTIKDLKEKTTILKVANFK